MSDIEETRQVLVFVSDEGRVVGVGGQSEEGEMVGACLAYLASPIMLSEWVVLLARHDDPEAAADAAIERFGGFRLHHITVLNNPTILPSFAGGPVGEA
jgi:hypothetical protein